MLLSVFDGNLLKHFVSFSEPGYYKEGDFGIRLENILEVIVRHVRSRHYSGARFLGFKDVTLVPYEPKLIDFNMLTFSQVRIQTKIAYYSSLRHSIAEIVA